MKSFVKLAVGNETEIMKIKDGKSCSIKRAINTSAPLQFTLMLE